MFFFCCTDEEESLAVGITDGLFSWRDTPDSSISEYCDIDLEETQSLLQENNDEERCDGDDRNPVHGTLLLQDINLSVHKVRYNVSVFPNKVKILLDSRSCEL